jgi:hypothetical protein
MGKVWVLDTETKGTGAEMVPLEKALERPTEKRRLFADLKPEPRREEAPEASETRSRPRFKVVDVMTREALVEDVGTRAAVEALAGVRSAVDVSVYVWEETRDRWRQLSHRERRLLWDLRGALTMG